MVGWFLLLKNLLEGTKNTKTSSMMSYGGSISRVASSISITPCSGKFPIREWRWKRRNTHRLRINFSLSLVPF
jgi:hypothetical protein